MGILRYFLALAVLMVHTPTEGDYFKPFVANGGLPVQTFFIISGFYMSLIFEKYQLQSFKLIHLRDFYFARALRIYPVYFVCLLITLYIYSYDIIPPPPFHHISEVMNGLLRTWDAKFFYLFSNIAIFGQSLMRFCNFDPATGGFVFQPLVTNYFVPHLMGAGISLLGQSWSLSLELTFYLLVPFLLNRSIKFILLITLLSFLLRVVLYHLNYDNYSIQHAVFPTALGVFLLGVLSHRVIYPYVKQQSDLHIKKMGYFILTGVIVYSYVIYRLFVNANFKYWIFIFLIAAAIPYLFQATKNSKIDRFIGELSFPIYMSQFFCIAVAMRLMYNGHYPIEHLGRYVLLVGNIAALGLLFLVVRPIDKFRHARFEAKAARKLQNDYVPEALPIPANSIA
jgi:peptidoglycan/LPS O-acetylase OafA/YrhL